MLSHWANSCNKLELCSCVLCVECSFGLVPVSPDACSSSDSSHWLLHVLSPPPNHSKLGCQAQEHGRQRFMDLENQPRRVTLIWKSPLWPSLRHGGATANGAVNNGNCANFTAHTDASALQTHLNKGMTGTCC